MAKVLHVIAHPNPAQSRTLKIAESFIAGYRESHPNDEIEVLDLYQAGVRDLHAPHVSAIGKGRAPETMNDQEKHAWGQMMMRVEQFKNAQTVIITAPMWNLNIPSILKAYIDHIILAGFTFRYTEHGPEGMMQGHNMVLINTTGGEYSQPPMNQFEHCISYLKTIFGFIGMDIKTTVYAEGLDMVAPEESQKRVESAKQQAHEAGRDFH